MPTEVVRILAVGTVLSWPLMSVAGKLISPKNHFRSTGELVPRASAKLVIVLAAASMIVELVVAILVLREYVRLAAAILAPAVVAYTAFIVLAIRDGRPVKCSCFVGVGSELGIPAVARNVWLAGASFIVMFTAHDPVDLNRPLILFSIGLFCLSLATISEGSSHEFRRRFGT